MRPTSGSTCDASPAAIACLGCPGTTRIANPRILAGAALPAFAAVSVHVPFGGLPWKAPSDWAAASVAP